LLLRTAAALRNALGDKEQVMPLTISTERLRVDRNRRAPYRIWDNWDDEQDREKTILALAERFNLKCSFDPKSAAHGRKLMMAFADGSQAILLFDQGFGYWNASGGTQHNFRIDPARQAKALFDSSAMISGSGESYVALTSA
jgi:hypothetical protein